MTNKVTTDVDIDAADRDIVLSMLPYTDARINRENGVEKHKTGVYFQAIPYDPVTNLADIDYNDAEQEGYFKIDFLNVNLYKGVRDEEHLVSLLKTEPMWELLEHEEFVKKLFHVSNYASLLKKLKPTSIEQLAAVLAIIRPSKRHLQDKSWDQIMEEVWKTPTDGSYFYKKPHAVAYSAAIVVQMNLIIEDAESGM